MIVARVLPCPAASRAAPPFRPIIVDEKAGRNDARISPPATVPGPDETCPALALRTETNSPDGCA